LTYTGTTSNGTAYSSQTLPTLPGTYTVTATIADTNYQLIGNHTAKFTIGKASETLTIAAVGTKTYGDEPFQLEVTQIGNGTLSFTSSDTNILTVDANGIVTICGAGTATVTVSAMETNLYTASSAAVGITIGQQVVTHGTTDTVTAASDRDGENDSVMVEFSDLNEKKWYYQATEFVLTTGLMKGYGNGKFGPEDQLTRAQLVQVLYNQAGCPEGNWENTFTDVGANTWYADAACWAAAEGLVYGYGDGRFGPNEYVTREQMVMVFWRQAGCPTPTTTQLDFSDGDEIHNWAMEAMLWATENGIIHGVGNGRLSPTTVVTRAQLAQILENMAENS
jgi:predicted membrane protein